MKPWLRLLTCSSAEVMGGAAADFEGLAFHARPVWLEMGRIAAESGFVGLPVVG